MENTADKEVVTEEVKGTAQATVTGTGTKSREEQIAEIAARQLSEREERIARMVAKNISQKDIAASENVSEGFISQLLSTDHVRQRIAGLKAKTLGERMVYDELLNKTQLKVMSRLSNMVNAIEKPLDAANILAKLDGLKRQVDPHHGTGNQATTNIVNITLPGGAVLSGLVQNDKRQVIEIGGIPIVNAGAASLQEKLNEKRAAETIELAEPTNPTGQRYGPNDL